MRRVTILVILVLSGIYADLTEVFGQAYEPGSSYRLGGYVEYLHGNMPLVISVPHGGYDQPDTIPEREGKFAKNQDIYTIEIAHQMYNHMYEISGKYPYVVINHLHRTRLDANRNITEAANGNPAAEEVWRIYQSRIDSITNHISETCGAGLFIDLHGHRHRVERMELGYLISAEELRLDDDVLNSGLLNEYTSIRHLLDNRAGGLSVAEMIRGDKSLGSMLVKRGQACMPSKQVPYPDPGEPYFTGGFNTMQHGSRYGGNIDGIQIEIDLSTRSKKGKQKKVAQDVSEALIEFLNTHYDQDL
jgi:hypothetical protein